MIDFGLAALGAFLYFTGQYGYALLLVVLAIFSGVGAVLMSIANPNWYAAKRREAGFQTDFLNPGKGIGGLILTKIVTTAVLIWAARHIAEKAGYLS